MPDPNPPALIERMDRLETQLAANNVMTGNEPAYVIAADAVAALRAQPDPQRLNRLIAACELVCANVDHPTVTRMATILAPFLPLTEADRKWAMAQVVPSGEIGPFKSVEDMLGRRFDPQVVRALATTLQMLWRLQSDHAISAMRHTGLAHPPSLNPIEQSARLTDLGRAALALAEDKG
ncbi:MAG: hypothetical protein KGL39_30295 [Patescibacteria group bacterium]|nr:hypothetical protein [Patescibacteria group bacterium]